MTERRGSRFLLEVLFLVALAGVLTYAKLRGAEIAAIMLLGWVIVALLEWAAWRGEPHFGSGLPPRYYVPTVNLPPAQPLEQVDAGYPDASRDEAPTWIAPAALRAEMLGEWPVANQPAEREPEPELEAATAIVRLPPVSEPEPVLELEPEPEPEPTIDVVLTQSVQRLARYSLDPLAEPPAKRRFGRSGTDGGSPAVEVPARPEGVRALPGRSTGQD